LFLVLAVSHLSASSTYTNFDVPGATKLYPYGVNNSGAATGTYLDSAGLAHGFLFQPDGTVTTFDTSGGHTTPLAINGPGKIAGYYTTDATRNHGFLRNLAGGMTTLNEPSALCFGTQAMSLNDAGQIAGVYWDATTCTQHGFLRDALGNYTSFDVPGGDAVLSAYVTQNGEIAGTYASSVTLLGGYTRDTSGNLTTFAVSVTNAYDTSVNGINASGEITGIYSLLGVTGPQTYVRDAAGNITTFTVNGWTSTAGIKDSGDIVGSYLDSSTLTSYGWLRNTAGTITSFKDPAAGGGFYAGTYPLSVSGNGKVAGYYVDSALKVHGFVQH
jgi:hypothetical protein